NSKNVKATSNRHESSNHNTRASRTNQHNNNNMEFNDQMTENQPIGFSMQSWLTLVALTGNLYDEYQPVNSLHVEGDVILDIIKASKDLTILFGGQEGSQTGPLVFPLSQLLNCSNPRTLNDGVVKEYVQWVSASDAIRESPQYHLYYDQYQSQP